jgi:hypothetical protein
LPRQKLLKPVGEGVFFIFFFFFFFFFFLFSTNVDFRLMMIHFVCFGACACWSLC